MALDPLHSVTGITASTAFLCYPRLFGRAEFKARRLLWRLERVRGCRTGNPHEKFVNTEQLAVIEDGVRRISVEGGRKQ